ncbi:MAG: hypothetical protein RL318_489, partial [Fibrobacterota bacterium]
MTPSAWVQPATHMSIGVNSHFNDTTYNRDRNLFIAVGFLPHTEFVGRYAFKDLSYNGKLGYSLGDTTWHRFGLALGTQDLWGGQRFFHSKYIVATQRLAMLEGSLGWGTGPEEHVRHRLTQRLGGWFWGGQLDLLPSSTPVQLSILHDDDGAQSHTGGRIEAEVGDWRLVADIAKAWEQKRWDAAFQLHTTLPSDRSRQVQDSVRMIRLRAGPWAQSFLGTEIGDFDVQAAVEVSGFFQPQRNAWVGGRLRTLVYASQNFQPGKPFATYRQDPDVWMEGASLGWRLGEATSGNAYAQAGFVDGSWGGGAMELVAPPLLKGVQVGALLGGWHSGYWEAQRWVSLPWMEWTSPRRNWQVNVDAGKFWNQDNG